MATIEERIYDGNRAREVLENEAFQQAFADIDAELMQRWRDLSSTEETRTARDRLHLSLTLLAKVRNCLTTTLETGKLAMAELEHRRSTAERAKDAISGYFRP